MAQGESTGPSAKIASGVGDEGASTPGAARAGALDDDLAGVGITPLPPLETAPETTPETVSGPIPAPHRANGASSTPRLRQTPFRRRLPRFIRAKKSHRPPLALQDRDLELLRTVSDYRLISTPQLLRLFDDSRDGLYRRLQKLFHHGYLDRLGTNPNAPLVYGLGRRGAEILEAPSTRDVGERYVMHQLMVGDFRIALAFATRNKAITVTWRAAPQEGTVRPDGFFGLEFPDRPQGQNRAFFFVEADRSTMTGDRFAAKLAAYAEWRRRGGHTASLGIRNFRVLTVTRSEARLTNLAGRAAAVDAGAPIFWFTAEPRLAPREAVLNDVWTVPGLEARQSLVPAAPHPN